MLFFQLKMRSFLCGNLRKIYFYFQSFLLTKNVIGRKAHPQETRLTFMISYWIEFHCMNQGLSEVPRVGKILLDLFWNPKCKDFLLWKGNLWFNKYRFTLGFTGVLSSVWRHKKCSKKFSNWNPQAKKGHFIAKSYRTSSGWKI